MLADQRLGKKAPFFLHRLFKVKETPVKVLFVLKRYLKNSSMNKS